MTTLSKPVVCRLVVLAFVLLALPRSRAQDWIWMGSEPGEEDVRFFRKVFHVADTVEKATLTLTCDNRAAIYIDGKTMGTTVEWNEPAVLDVTRFLPEGDHLLAVHAQNKGGPAGLIAKLELTFPRGRKQTIPTDGSWKVSTSSPAGWNKVLGEIPGFVAATSLGQHGMQPWGMVLAGATPRKPNQATDAATLKVAPGFKVELLKSAQPQEGSWVSMTVDPKGRLIISPQGREPMRRLTLGDGGRIVREETIDLPVSGAMGLLYAFDSLYVNGQGPDGYHLYRLRDSNGDDKYDAYELIHSWKGGAGEHGAHGIVLGPDRKLYTICGNFVEVPEGVLPTSPHRNYADDLILPRVEDGSGFGAGRKPPGGFVVRLDPDGKNPELFASGQRNTYDLAFNADGELFGFDSDMEWDWGTPWYRPIRLFHMVSGADHGFREGSAKWPEYYPDSLPPTVNIGIGSPTGVKFATGARFPAAYQRACYIMDWTYGRILAVHLSPMGSSYEGRVENFVAGKPLNVTDLEIGHDGAMYFTTGGRGTQSGLYRVSFSGAADAPVGPDPGGATARKLRHQLEAYHREPNPDALKKAWDQLDSEDRFLRYAARLAVERQPLAQWQERALQETRPRASLTALLALARYGTAEVRSQVLDRTLQLWAGGLTESGKLEALRVQEVCISRLGQPDPATATAMIRALEPELPARSWSLNRELSQVLVALNAPGIAGKLISLRDQAATQEEQIHYMFLFRHVAAAATAEDRTRAILWFRKTPLVNPPPAVAALAVHRSQSHSAETLQWFKDAGRDYGDGNSLNGFLTTLRNSMFTSLAEGERLRLAALLAEPKTPPRASPQREYKFVKDWKTADLLGDLDQVGRGRKFENGRSAFEAAKCLACHRFGNAGGAIGPDLTAVATRFTRKDLLESILEPSKVLSEQYQNLTVSRKNGDDVTGRLVEETAAKLVLIVNPLTGEKIEVPKNDVAGRIPSKLSPMPEGLASILTKEDLLDLIAYMESGGRKEHAAFAK